MGQHFVACDREQSFLMPPDVREWLPEDHLAWFVIDAVGEMNLATFHAAYRRDGRPAYDPAMMVALLLYAYARGMIVCGDVVPMHRMGRVGPSGRFRCRGTRQIRGVAGYRSRREARPPALRAKRVACAAYRDAAVTVRKQDE